jgi:hypothetical protein
MGLIEFVKEAGAKIGLGKSKEEATRSGISSVISGSRSRI